PVLHRPLQSLPFLSTATPTPEIYTLSLHDALPISAASELLRANARRQDRVASIARVAGQHRLERRSVRHGPPDEDLVHARDDCGDRKSTRLNSSHVAISYAVFCLKKKNNHRHIDYT